MIDSGLDAALQKAVLTALRANAPLAAIIGTSPNDRIYDRVPQPSAKSQVTYPYLTIGDDDITDDRTTCNDGSDCLVTVHVWSRAVGRTEAKQIGGLVRVALDQLIAIDNHNTVAGGFETAVYRAGNDALEIEGVLVFRYLVDSLLE